MYVLIYSRCLSISSPPTEVESFVLLITSNTSPDELCHYREGHPPELQKFMQGLCATLQRIPVSRGLPLPKPRNAERRRTFGNNTNRSRITSNTSYAFQNINGSRSWKKTQQRQKTKTYELNFITLTRGPIH